MKHLPGLTELRAVAALCVVPGHIEALKPYYGMDSQSWFPIPGKIGVVLFFVLSGFLITTLVREEMARHGRIDMWAFYAKRALRIWPLYFFIMGVSVLVLNRVPFFTIPGLSEQIYPRIGIEQIILMCLILPNYLIVVVPYASQSWSIGIEEQFYILYPILVRFIQSPKWIAAALLIVIASPEIVQPLIKDLPWNKYILLTADQLKYFGCIAIGCLAALLATEQSALTRRFLFHPVAQVAYPALFALFVVAIAYSGNEEVVDFRLHALIFACLIVNLAYNPARQSTFRLPGMKYLGTISYGIYMYHTVAIVCVLKIIPSLINSGFVSGIAIYILSFGLTIILSGFSYRYFEMPFLRVKRVFAKQ